MAVRITLPFWPTSLDCLSWSSDNIIAVGGGDQIGILIPRLHETGPDESHWNSTFIKANAFTTAEAPLLRPLTFENFSPGEEQSHRHVHALEWSPPGLGRFRHCVLAVLSTNHLLSVWECDGKADMSTNWRRKVIVNHALIRYYAHLDKEAGETEQLFSERKQVSQRVRAFAWSPFGSESLRARHLTTSAHFLVVTTEAGDLLFLRVQAPYDVLALGSTEWRVEVVSKYRLDELIDLEKSNNDSFLKDDHSIADHIAWGPWRRTEDSILRATIAFIAGRKLYTFQILATDPPTPLIDVFKQTRAKLALPSRSDLTGPLRFIPKTNLLDLFAADTIYCIDTSSPLNGDAHITSHHLDNRWDEVSGVAFSQNSTQPANIHVVSHLSTSTAETTVLPAPLTNSEVSTPPKWQAAIVECKDAFSSQHSLDGHVQERTWGVASSPLGDYVATAITLLPSDSVAHVIPSERQVIVNITQEVQFEDDDLLYTNAKPSYVVSEVILTRIQRYLEQLPGAIEVEHLVQMLPGNIEFESTGGGLDIGLPLSEDADIYRIVRYLRSQVFDRPDMTKERNTTLARLALGLDSTPRVSSQIIHSLIAQVTNLSSNFHEGGELSEHIRRTYGIVNAKLNREPQSAPAQNNEDSASETCRICKELILFESVKWARCASGHQFSRCALTFLAIQEPGFSKHCGVCGLQLLNEWKVLALMSTAGDSDVAMVDVVEGQRGELDDENNRAIEGLGEDWVQMSHRTNSSKEPSASLARVLFAAFDTCIYCGGKFIA